MKKNITIMLFLLCSSCVVIGQNIEYAFAYDASGNRTKRKLIILKDDSKSLQTENTEDSVVYNYNVFSYDVKIYPNPTQGVLNLEIIDFPSDINCELYVYDLQGRIIFSTTIKTSLTEIDFSQHPNGMYVLQLIIDNRKKEWSVLKQ